jgi:hypothetical protein
MRVVIATLPKTRSILLARKLALQGRLGRKVTWDEYLLKHMKEVS